MTEKQTMKETDALCPICGEETLVEFWSGVVVCDNCGHLIAPPPGKGPRRRTYKDRDAGLLKALPNPGGAIELRIDVPEFTILGALNQPDFGTLRLWFYPGKSIVELKSLKFYIHQYRDTLVSYERVANCIFDDIMAAYEPHRLRLEVKFRPRGGIYTSVVIDSDWAARGGGDETWPTEQRRELTL